jgi:hypothetical protein
VHLRDIHEKEQISSAICQTSMSASRGFIPLFASSDDWLLSNCSYQPVICNSSSSNPENETADFFSSGGSTSDMTFAPELHNSV